MPRKIVVTTEFWVDEDDPSGEKLAKLNEHLDQHFRNSLEEVCCTTDLNIKFNYRVQSVDE